MRNISRRSSLVIVAILWVMACVAPSAWAQTSAQAMEMDEVRSLALGRVGPFYFAPSLSIENIGFDNNVFVDPDTGDPQSDFSATVTPAVRVWLPVARRALLSAHGSAGLVYFNEFKSERALNPGTGVDAVVFLQRLTVRGSADYRRARERPSFEIDVRSLRTEHGVAGGVEYRVRPKLSLALSGFQRVIRFDQDEEFLGTRLRDAMDRVEHGAGLSVAQRLTPKTSVEILAERTVWRYDHSPAKDAVGFRIMPGVSFSATALITGSAHVGYRSYRPTDSDVPAYDGVAADVALGYVLRSATGLDVTWRRDIGQSFEAHQPYYVVNNLGGRLRRQIIGRIDVIGGVDQHRYAYRDVLGLASSASRVDTTRIYTVDLGMRLTRQSRVGFAVSRSDRTSTTRRERDFARFRAGVSFNYGLSR